MYEIVAAMLPDSLPDSQLISGNHGVRAEMDRQVDESVEQRAEFDHHNI